MDSPECAFATSDLIRQQVTITLKIPSFQRGGKKCWNPVAMLVKPNILMANIRTVAMFGERLYDPWECRSFFRNDIQLTVAAPAPRRPIGNKAASGWGSLCASAPGDWARARRTTRYLPTEVQPKSACHYSTPSVWKLIVPLVFPASRSSLISDNKRTSNFLAYAKCAINLISGDLIARPVFPDRFYPSRTRWLSLWRYASRSVFLLLGIYK